MDNIEERIVEVLKSEKKARSIIEINDLLDFSSVEELKNVQETLKKMVEDGIMHETKKGNYILLSNCSHLETGFLRINKTGNGFVDIVNGTDIFVPKECLNGAINGDYVEIEWLKKYNEIEGNVIRILKRDLKNIVGELIEVKHKLKFKPDDEKLDLKIEIEKESLKGCVEGHKVLLEIVRQIKEKHYIAKIKKVIGHKNDPGVDIISIALRHNIEIDFSPSTYKELENIADEVTISEMADRKDLTNEVIFTIDGEDTKDIDDAISIKKTDQYYELGVHIADVSHYVSVGTSLYEDAYLRGTSSYLADTVIPMIPHQLSNGICSLNEAVNRLTISCVMKIDFDGDVIEYDIFPSVIKSNKKMTYNCVNEILEKNIIPDGYAFYVPYLVKMKELSLILSRNKKKKGYIDFGIDEAKIVQDKNGKCIDVVKRTRGIGENIIEDFMIVANETVASHLANMDLPFIYRVHDYPNPDKIEDFINLVKQMGYNLKTNVTKLTPITMQKILEELKEKKEFPILSSMLLRSMKKAIYSTNNIGHFGLASNNYTHFTSPIRRFPDLTVHRLLRTYLFNNKMDIETINFNSKYLIDVAQHSSTTELNAVEAERDVNDMKMAEYMLEHIGEVFKGIITSVTNFGFFVELENLIEGLVHISTLKGYFYYEPKILSLISENNQVKYRVGDEVTIKVVRASKENGTIDFEIYAGDENGNKE